MRINFTILLIIISFFAKAQLGLDGNEFLDDEVERIILNYHNHDVKKFKIVYKSDFGKEVVYYKFENDSIFTHKWENSIDTYAIKQNRISYIDTEADKIYFETHIIENLDSADFNTYSSYQIKEADTILLYQKVKYIDTLKKCTVIINKVLRDSYYNLTKREMYNLPGDSIRTDYYEFGFNKWYLFSNETEFEKITTKKKSKIEVITINRLYKKMVSDSSKVEYRPCNNEIIRTIYYKRNGRIKKVKISEKDSFSSFVDIEILKPSKIR
ncbi:MAG: hypothetical protein K9J13_08530 [Saprospiraceae bacterium]|nr:hypothetical protein [Saprospiraceae bacterium]